jgi:hypothetical protein
MLYATTTEEGIHTGVNIFVEMETLLSLGDTTTSCHEDTVEEIRVTVMEFTTNLSESTSEHGTECLFLSGGNVTEDTNVLRENVFTGSKNGDRVELSAGKTGSVRRNVVGCHLFEFGKNAADLQAFLKVVVLVGVDKLDVFTTVENDSVVLVVRLAVTENGVTGKLDTELGSTQAIVHDLRVTIDQSRVNARLVALVDRRLLVQVRNLKIRVGTEQELSVLHLFLAELGISLHGHADLVLAPGHALKLALKLIGVTTEHLDNLGVLDTVQKLDRTAVVHETRDRTVQSLRTERGPNTSSESVFRSGRLETNAVERKIVDLALSGILLILLVISVELRGLVRENLGVLDKAVPLVRVKLLEVLEECNTRVWLIFANNLAE